MSNIQQRMAGTVEKYNNANQQLQDLQKQGQEIQTEIHRLEGEYRGYEALLAEENAQAAPAEQPKILEFPAQEPVADASPS